MSKWELYKLDELFEESNQGVNTTTEKVKYSENGTHPVIRAKNIYQYKIDYEDVVYINHDTFINLKDTVKPKEGDVLYTNIGSQFGNASSVTNINDFAIAWNVFRITPKKSILDANYLVYLLNDPQTRNFIKNLNSSSTMPFVSGGVIRSLEFLIPSLPEQKAIAGVLSSLDDKIDLLHSQNKTLEAMAETLFRQWFIEEVEDDWGKGTLGDILDLKYGKGLTKALRTGEGYPVVGSSGIVDYHSEFLVQGPGIVIGRKGTLGKVIFLQQNFYPIDTTYYIKTKLDNSNLLFEYFLLRTLRFEEMNTDSAVPGLNRDLALSTELIIPPTKKIYDFNIYANNIIEKKNSNSHQIKILCETRNTLLPKLMSGEAIIEV